MIVTVGAHPRVPKRSRRPVALGVRGRTAQGRATRAVPLGQRLPDRRGPQGRTPVVLAAYGGLLLGDPAGPSQAIAANTGSRKSPLPEVHQVGQQHGERHRKADPEPRAYEENPGQLDQVEQHQRQEDPPAPVQSRDATTNGGTTRGRSTTNGGTTP
jgi:hypothetical protein